MKMTEISIQNFKGIENITYTPVNKVAALLGKNGAGKTSFLQAIRFALTGDTPDNCIMDGKDFTTVSIKLDDGNSFSRTKYVSKPTKVVVNGKTTPAKNLETLLQTVTGVNKDAMRVITSADVIQGLSSSEFGDFIMSFLTEKMNIDILESYIPGLTAEGKSELAHFFPKMPEEFDIAKVKEAYDYFFNLRKAANSELKIAEGRVKSFKGIEPKKKLEDIDAEIAALMKLDGAAESAKTAIRLYNSAKTMRKKAEESIANLESQIAANTSKKPVPSQLAEILSKKKDYRDRIIGAEKMIQTLADNTALFEHTLANLEKPVCPLSEKLVCTTDKTAVKDEFKEMIEANKEGIAYNRSIISDCNEHIASLEADEKAYRANEAEYTKKVMLITRLDSEKKNLPVLPKPPEVLEVKDYSEEIRELQKERQSVLAYQEHLKNIAKYDALKEKVDMFDFLTKAFNPKGSVMHNIMDFYMGYFEKEVNDRAALFSNFRIKFTTDNGVEYWIQTARTKEFREFSTLSHGEQLISMFLILDMLNKLSGTRMMFLDDINHLDKNAFGSLFTLIQSPVIQDDYDHIILASVDNKDIVDTIPTSGIDFIF